MSQHTGQCEMRVRKPGIFIAKNRQFSTNKIHETMRKLERHPWSATEKPHKNPKYPKVRDVRRRDLPSYAVPVRDCPAFLRQKSKVKKPGLIFFKGSWAVADTKKSNYTKKRNSFSP